MCGRNGRGKRTEPTGKFSPAARAAISASSTAPFLLECLGGRQAPHAGGKGDASLTDAPGRDAAVTGVDSRDGAVVVSLGGELDLYNAEEVRSALLEACSGEPELLVVDLGEVRFIDSTALG